MSCFLFCDVNMALNAKVLWVLVTCVCVCRSNAKMAVYLGEQRDLGFAEGEYMTLHCHGRTFDSNQFPAFERPVTVPLITFIGCRPPLTAFAEELKTLNITEPKRLEIIGVPVDSLLLSKHLAGLSSHVRSLSLRALSIERSVPIFDTSPLRPEIDFLDSLNSLTELELANVAMPRFQTKTLLRNVTLRDGVTLGPWGYCKELRSLTIQDCDVSALPPAGWLTNCSKLHFLRIERQALEKLTPVLHGAHSIRELKLHLTKIRYFPSDLLVDTKQLRLLNLSVNDIVYIANDAFTKLNYLQEVDLSHNELPDTLSVEVALLRMPYSSVVSISLDYNPRLRLCDDRFLSPYKQWLKRLSLRGTRTSEICLKNAYAITYLDLFENNISEVRIFINGTFRDKPRFQELQPKLTFLELRRNPIKMLMMSEAYYKDLKEKETNLTVKIDSLLDCDCQHGWLARALRDKPQQLFVPDARCSDENNTKLISVPLKRIECDKLECAPGCICRRQWHNNATEAQCRELRTIPHVPGLRALFAYDNRIETIHADDIPDTLLWMDISKNLISRVNASAVKTLFAVPERRINLTGNPIACDCNNQPLLDSLQAHHKQVLDYNKLTCLNKTDAQLLLQDVSSAQLCAAEATSRSDLPLAVGWGSALATLAMLAAVLALYWRYERPFKVYLYARGCCFCCVHEEELDAERPYDAFLSFSHHDENFVIEELLPRLESEPCSYKLCIHYRDWVVGEFIPAQITRSVEQSRRTVIVLSKNFVESVWGLLEFRAAHVSALVEGRSRIIVIVLDDVVYDENLDAELRSYVRNNTYLKWGDSRFWDKIRFAMPHHSVRSVPTSSTPFSPPTQEPIPLAIQQRVQYSSPNISVAEFQG